MINIGKGSNQSNKRNNLSLDYDNGTPHPPPTAGTTPKLISPNKFKVIINNNLGKKAFQNVSDLSGTEYDFQNNRIGNISN